MGLGCKPCGKWQSIFRKQTNRLAAEAAAAANKKKSESIEKIKVSYKKENEIT